MTNNQQVLVSEASSAEFEGRPILHSVGSDDGMEWRDYIEYVVDTFQFGEFSFSVSQVDELPPTQALFMLSEMAEHDTEISGKCVWAGSQLLCQYLIKHKNIVSNKRILELGAGTGLGSMLSLSLGASMAVATDGDSEVVALLRENALRNKSEVETTELFWGNEQSLETFTKKFPEKSFDMVIAGDVLYKFSLIEPFFSTAARLMTPSGQLLLCHIPRADVTHEKVLEAATKAHNFSVETLDLDSVDIPEGCKVEDARRAKLYSLRLNA